MFFCIAGLALAGAAHATTWKSVRATVATRGIANNGSLYVSAAANGIWTSKDLKAWTHVAVPASAGSLYEDVIWDGSRFLAVGFGIVSSNDGVNWKTVLAPDGKELHGIAKMGSVYLVVGDGNRILRSTDAKTWHSVSSGVTPASGNSVVFTGIATDGTQFVVAGEEYSGTTILNSVADLMVTSMDGQTWAAQSVPGPAGGGFTFTDANDVATGGGHYFAGGFFAGYSSPDAVTWTLDDISNSVANPNADSWLFNRVSYLNGQFLALGVVFPNSGGAEQVAVFKSGDGVTWSAHDLEDRGASIFGMAGLTFNSGTYVAAGYQGVYTSSDANHWTKRSSSPQAELWRCVITGGGRDIAFGQEGVLVTANGSQWPDSYTKVNQTASQGRGCGAYGAGIYVSAGSELMWSAGGKTWTAATVTGSGTNFGWHSVVWDGSRFVALRNDATMVNTSSDGKSWNSVFATIPPGTIALDNNNGTAGSMVSAAGMLVAWGTIDGAPLIMASADGTNWNQAVLPGVSATDSIRSVASDGTHFVAIGNKADGSTLVLTSNDGSHWASGSASQDHVQWYSVVFGDSEYVAIGIDTQSDRGVVAEGTVDGSKWTLTRLDDTSTLNDLGWDGTQYIIAGSYDIEQGLPAGSSGSGGGGGSGGGTGGSGGGGGGFGLLLLAILTGLGIVRLRPH